MHPYLARREGTEPVTYLDERLRPTLGARWACLYFRRTFEDGRVMADFSGSEAEELRRALSFHRSQEKMETVCAKLRQAMAAKGSTPRWPGNCSIRSVVGRLLFPREPRHQFRFDRLCELLVESASNPGILLQPAQQSADGLLQQRHADL